MKKYLSLFKWWEIAFVVLALAVAITLAIVFNASALTILTTISAFIAIALLAKGVVLGNFVMIVQCVFYAWMNAINSYYGEVILTVCISIPMYFFAIYFWLKKQSSSNVVIVNTSLKPRDYFLGFALAAVLTTAMFFIMRALDTANLAISTITVFVGILASYFSIRRSALNFALYILSNACLLVMWLLVVIQTGQVQYYVTIFHTCISMTFNAYAIYNWQKLKKEQNSGDNFEVIMKAIRCDEK